ncbi:MAG: M15 family metallopeptidase [Fibrobacteres bacterium]|jgi:D-alanyl-D-alanine dipeptidase|nr:M15 family metallopeptidase [Fibrobacterota bacterium]
MRALFPIFLLLRAAFAATPGESLRQVQASAEFVDISANPALAIDLKYASADNFLAADLYGDFRIPFLHRIAAAKLDSAARLLAAERPGAKLVVYDALRPRSVQYRLWDKVKGTPREKYVANPATGSMHNYGFAVDLGVLDASGKAMDMGSPFDDFSDLAQPRLESAFLKSGALTPVQVADRKLLRRIMEKAGFIQLPLEWWHFDALPKAAVKSGYRIVE